MLEVCKNGRGIVLMPRHNETLYSGSKSDIRKPIPATTRVRHSPMSRLILYIAIAAVAYYLYRSLRRPKPAQQYRVRSHDTVRCEHCGVHLSADEAVDDGPHHYCSEEHRRLALHKRD